MFLWFRADDHSFDQEFLFAFDYDAFTTNWERHNCNEGDDNEIWRRNKQRDFYLKHQQCWESNDGYSYRQWHSYTVEIDFDIPST